MNSADTLAMLARVMGGLVVVLVLVGLSARIARRTRGRNGTSGLRVVERVGLSREAHLAVVEVSDRLLLLGVTAQGITMLAALDQTDQPLSAHLDSGPLEVMAEAMPPTSVERSGSHGPHAGERRLPVPDGVALNDYPDLASALRAAGRTSGPEGSAGSSAGPRSRAEARAQTQSQGKSWPRPAIPQQRGTKPSGSARGTRRIVVPAPPGQASGSVLSPRTWRQGIDALRELTVRRG